MFSLVASLAFGSLVLQTNSTTNSATACPKGPAEPGWVTADGGCDKCNQVNLCAGQPIGPDGCPGTVGTPDCMPIVCKAVCTCRRGLPEPPTGPPIKILPPPPPEWNDAQTVDFCSCMATKALDCTTDVCRNKLKVVAQIVDCTGANIRVQAAGGVTAAAR